MPHVTKYVLMKVGKTIIRCHTKQKWDPPLLGNHSSIQFVGIHFKPFPTLDPQKGDPLYPYPKSQAIYNALVLYCLIFRVGIHWIIFWVSKVGKGLKWIPTNCRLKWFPKSGGSHFCLLWHLIIALPTFMKT